MTTRHKARGIAFSMLAALVGIALAVSIAAAGHGWSGPLLVSLALPFFYPWVVLRATSVRRSPNWHDVILLVLALLTDLFLIHHLLTEEQAPFARSWASGSGLILAWSLVWCGWQGMALRNWRRNTEASR